MLQQPATLADKPKFADLKGKFIAYEEHVNRKEKLRILLKEKISNLKSSEEFMILDFKVNLKIRGCRNELSQDYYHHKQQPLFCVILITKTQKHIFNFCF